MDVLTSLPSGRSTLLANIHCSRTSVKALHYERMLAIRSFSLVSVWSAILDRHRSVEGDSRALRSTTTIVSPAQSSRSDSKCPKSARPKPARTATDDSSPTVDVPELNKQRIFQAIRLGFNDVVQFMLDTERVLTDYRDCDNKTLVFYATANSQPAVLRFLLMQTDCCLYVNVAADSGNTPLHAAANSGDVAVVRELLKIRDIKVDARNHLCDNATPLHLAAMHGHREIVRLLLEAGSSPSKLMASNKTVIDIAIDFDQLDIVDLLQPQQDLNSASS